MTSSTSFDQHLERVEAGEPLAPAVVRELAQAADILPLGMLADAMRRRLHGRRTSFVRVATTAFDGAGAGAVPATAREIRIDGHPPSLRAAVDAIAATRAAAGDRVVSALSWSDVTRFADGGTAVDQVLRSLRDAGLDGFAELPLDAMADLDTAVAQLTAAGFAHLRLTIDRMPAADRTEVWSRLTDVQQQRGGISAINPLPLALNPFRPTTGYEDVKAVAVARLAAVTIPHVQVDWRRYGPKLAQVALTFGADDIDGVSASDEAPEGRRRAPLEEIRRNIQAAGGEPVERDGAFRPL